MRLANRLGRKPGEREKEPYAGQWGSKAGPTAPGRGGWLAVAGCLATLLLGVVYAPVGKASQRPPAEVIISEIAWAGTAADQQDEWIELYNNTAEAVTLTGWTLSTGQQTVTLQGIIAGHGFYLLESLDDNNVSDVPADMIYFNLDLDNGGGSLTLRRPDGQVVDTANGDGGPWPGGSGPPGFYSMERLDADAPDEDDRWGNNNGSIRNGLDADGNPLNGTARQPNSEWPTGPPAEPDLWVEKGGPAAAAPGDVVAYLLGVGNSGSATATGVVVTDTLPAEFAFVGQDSAFPVSQPAPNLVVWEVGEMGVGSGASFYLTVEVGLEASGSMTNALQASTPLTESQTANNRATAVTEIGSPEAAEVLIEAVLYDGYELNDADEAVRLFNAGPGAAHISGWQISDGVAAATIPWPTVLGAGEGVWLTSNAVAFRRQFGFGANFEAAGSDPLVAQLVGAWPGFSNAGDEVLLRDADQLLVDALVYKGGNVLQPGWQGAAVEPYVVSGVFGEEGQILYRRRDPATGQPVADSDGAADWAQSRADVINGRKVLYPGWELDSYFFTAQVTQTAWLTVAIAPDNAYEAVARQIEAAQTSLKLEMHTLENAAIGAALAEAAGRGVAVTILLEGSPPGGLTNQEKYICREIEAAGGQCWFMISDSSQRIYDRYRLVHAKFMIVDGARAIVSSENFSPDSLPDDDKEDGTWGRRGVVLISDASAVVTWLEGIFAADLDPEAHADLRRWSATDPVYGPPPAGYLPVTQSGGVSYTVRYPEAASFQGELAFELIQSPENSLRSQDSLLGLIGRAGYGDRIMAQQLSERPHWGASTSNPTADPNPRLEAYVAAARRGATVWLMLDDFFDSPSSATSNRATCDQVNGIAAQEGLRLRCVTGNPTGLGIHNKMVLVRLDGRGFAHFGSINGTEQSSKGNREVAIQVQSDGVYELLADVFVRDWPHRLSLPLVFNNTVARANHVLISEVLYDPSGPDDAEFIELVNPTSLAVDLSDYSLGDAVLPTDFEDVRRFPPGTVLPPGGVLVVATTATAFRAQNGFNPDFEIVDTDPAVADLIDDPAWGDPAALLQLGNDGDEVILRDAAGVVVDVVVYGNGHFPGMEGACGLVPTSDQSLERFPHWQDTDSCVADFRTWPFPNPGVVPP